MKLFNFDEVSKAINKSKSGKAISQSHNEALQNQNSNLLSQKFFNLCFISGLNLTEWDTKANTKER